MNNDYNTGWTILHRFLECVIDPVLHAQVPLSNFSHEQLYRHVYGLCLRPQFRRQLASDFTATIERLLKAQHAALANCANSTDFLGQFAQVLKHDIWASMIVRDVFVYFEKVQSRFDGVSAKQDLRLAFLSAVKFIVIDPFELTLFDLLRRVDASSIASGDMDFIPFMLHDLVTVSPDYMALNIPLFEKYLRNVGRPSNYIELQIKFAKMEAIQDTQTIRQSWNESGVGGGGGDSASGEAWGIFKETLRKRTECEVDDDDTHVESAGIVNTTKKRLTVD
ncbi:hypothetical protein BDR26DRAFT_859908, partial [Obelidium mucronatum]